jgi:flagellar basal-body rod modification protein FlgD
MTITGTNPTSTNSVSNGANTVASRIPKKTLGQDDFLKLLTVQLAKQDPMKPMEDTAFMAQMAQFSALEQSSQMSKDIAGLRGDFAQQYATGMLGRTVTVNTDDGEVVGTVDAVSSSGGETRVSIGGSLYNLSQVVRVAPPVTAS